MNKKQAKLVREIRSETGREQLIGHLEKLAARLDEPNLTMDEFEKIKEKVLEIQAQINKLTA